MEITYSKYKDCYLPDLAVSQEEPAAYGRFGRMRLKYLKANRRVTYINLKTSGELTHHLNEIDREANEMLRLLIEQMAQAQGISEQLKEEDQMAWVGAVNNIHSAEEEVVMQDVIFCLNLFFVENGNGYNHYQLQVKPVSGKTPPPKAEAFCHGWLRRIRFTLHG